MSIQRQLALEAAIEASDLAEVDRLCEAGANPSGTLHGIEMSFMALAAELRDLHVVRALTAHGADLNERLGDGRTLAANAATASDSNAALSCLLEAGADPNIADAHGWTALHLASAYGYLSNVRTLLGYGAVQNVSTPDGLTPIDLAERNAHGETADLLRSL